MTVLDCWACLGTGTNQGSGQECGACKGWGHLAVTIQGPCNSRGVVMEGSFSREPEEPIEVRMERMEKRDVLSQDVYWWPRVGGKVALTDMSNRYLVNVLGFLERRATSLKSQTEWGIASFASSLGGEMAIDSIDGILMEIMEMPADAWLHEQPLVQKILALIEEGHDGPID